MSGGLGRVYLVGAGCGPAEWITLRGYRLLGECGAVVYDDLIDPELLEAAPRQAIRLYMGKREGRPSPSQEEINRALIDLARAGHAGVRLKGGVPFVFGGGGEEAQALQRAGIPFDVVPGVSSAVAIPGQAGIPVTHRGLSRSFHVVTARTADGGVDRIRQLAGAEGTLVVLMGLSRLEEIADSLLAGGRGPDTPAAVISGGCAPRPMAVRAPLSQIARAARQAGAAPPAVIVVGETAALDLTSPAARPLEGVRVALTGTPDLQARLRALLLELGASPFALMTARPCPLPVDFDWALLSREPNWVVLTSRNGVEAFFQALKEARVDMRSLSRCSFAVIGPSTGDALREHGITPDLCPEVHTTRGLAQALERAVHPGRPVRLFRSGLGSQDLYRELSRRFPAQDVPLYELRPDPADAAGLRTRLEEADYLVFSSASGVEFLLDQGVTLPDELTCVCIGPVTARALAARSAAPCLTAPEISVQGLVRAILTREKRDRTPHDA